MNMTVRFIFFCMALVAIAAFSVPVSIVLDGIKREHGRSMELATADPTPPVQVATEQNSADDLNQIESAAGDDATDDTSELSGGFGSGTTSALSDEEPVETAPKAETE